MTLRCMVEVEAWGPHPGCKEFMDAPDIFPCGGDAEWRVVWVERWMGQGYEFNAEILCADHMEEMTPYLTNVAGESQGYSELIGEVSATYIGEPKPRKFAASLWFWRLMQDQDLDLTRHSA